MVLFDLVRSKCVFIVSNFIYLFLLAYLIPVNPLIDTGSKSSLIPFYGVFYYFIFLQVFFSFGDWVDHWRKIFVNLFYCWFGSLSYE